MDSIFDASLFVSAFVTLFVIMDPVGTVPIFLSLTGGYEPPRIRRAARQAVLVSLVVIFVFAFFGQSILDYLHVSLPALQCAGGLLLLLVALELLTGRGDEPMAQGDTNVALVPLGTPLLADVFPMSTGRSARRARLPSSHCRRPCSTARLAAGLAKT